MPQVFYRKQFSDYLGEQRAIDDIVTFFTANIPPSPTGTPNPTPTPTSTPVPVTPTPTPSPTTTLTPSPTSTLPTTPTPTPTPTTTLTPSPTSTLTPTPTTTLTGTPTPTPTLTPTASPEPDGYKLQAENADFIQAENGDNINIEHTIPSPIDPDATTYINAVIAAGGILTTPQQTAINTFYVGLKADGIYNKFYYLHLFFGGTAGSNGLNSVNLGTYDLSFQGTWSHYTSGSTTTQSNSNYANSGFLISLASPSTTQTDFSFGFMLSNVNIPLSPYQYMGIGTSGSNYMIIGTDYSQGPTPGGLESAWSTSQRVAGIGGAGKSGVFNALSRSGATSYYQSALFNGASISGGLFGPTIYNTTFTPSATAYDLSLFRITGLNQFTMGGNALLNYASTNLTPTELNSFAQRANTLQVAFGRNIFTT